jgi:hypothetical protein
MSTQPVAHRVSLRPLALPNPMTKVREMAKEAAKAETPATPPPLPKPRLGADGVVLKRTKSGRTVHHPDCGCLKHRDAIDVLDDPKGRALESCKKCKPMSKRAELEAMTGKRAGARTFTACATCLKHGMIDAGELTEAEVNAKGYAITKTGTKYHLAECRFAKGPGFPKPEKKVKAKSEKKSKKNETTPTTDPPSVV